MKLTIYFDEERVGMLENLAHRLDRTKSNTVRWLIAQECVRQNLTQQLVPTLESDGVTLSIKPQQSVRQQHK